MTVWPETGGETPLGHPDQSSPSLRSETRWLSHLALGSGVMVEFYSLLISRSLAPAPAVVPVVKARPGAGVPSLLNQ